jgi:outer membrane protein OmpA-like peptidoglycan-associated protein
MAERKSKFMKAVLISIFLAACTFCGRAQKEDTLRVYFDIDVAQPSDKNLLSASLLRSVRELQAAIQIIGYADFLHNESYNLDLSQRRADAVKESLLRQDPRLAPSIVMYKGVGEQYSRDNNSVKGEPGMRKVEIIILYPVEKEVAPLPLPEEDKEQDTAAEKPEKKRIETLTKGESLELEGLSFVPGRHMIMPQSRPVLDDLLRVLRKHSKLRIEIQGHVCCTQGGKDGYDYDSGNYRLSENRAKAVYDYLIRNGIKASRLSYKGYAGTQPKVKEVSEETEQMNRRVEIKILDQ